MKRKLLSVFAIAVVAVAAQFTLPVTSAGALANPPAYNQSEIQAIQANVTTATTVAQALEAVQELANHYSITIAADCRDDYNLTRIGCEAVLEEDLPLLKETLATFVKEWAKYPVDFIAQSELQTVRLVKSVEVEVPNPSFDAGQPVSEENPEYIMQPRAAIPNSVNDEVIYSVESGPLSSVAASYMDNVIHHEFFHLYDAATNGGNYREPWPEWSALNDPAFIYGDGGSSCYIAGTCPSGDHVVEGFVSGYATSALLEDTAETFAFLMETATYVEVQEWIKTDTVLAAKIAFMKNFLVGQSPTMNEAYFANIHNLSAQPVGEGTGNGEATAPGAPNTGVEQAPSVAMLALVSLAFLASLTALVALLVKKCAFAFIRK